MHSLSSCTDRSSGARFASRSGLLGRCASRELGAASSARWMAPKEMWVRERERERARRVHCVPLPAPGPPGRSGG